MSKKTTKKTTKVLAKSKTQQINDKLGNELSLISSDEVDRIIQEALSDDGKYVKDLRAKIKSYVIDRLDQTRDQILKAAEKDVDSELKEIVKHVRVEIW